MKTYTVDDHVAALPDDSGVALNELANSLLSKNLIFFFGAGLSFEYPSLLPLAMNSSLPGLKQSLAEMLVRTIPVDLLKPVTEDLEKLTLEHLLDQCARILGEDALDLLDVLDATKLSSSPNYRHYVLALLAKHGLCRYFFTVNFDNLLETAFEDFTIPLLVPEKTDREARGYRTAMQSSRSQNWLFKLHGTIEKKASLLTTVEKIANGLPTYKQSLLQHLFSAHDTFFIGYSDNDLDVFPFLKRIASAQKIFWYQHSEPPQEHIRRFLTTRPHHIFVGDLDDILNAVLRQLTLSDNLILSKLNVSSLEEIQEVESSTISRRKDQITAYFGNYQDRLISPEAARLILSNTVGIDKISIRKTLLDSLEFQNLAPTLRYSYYAELAERSYSDGDLSNASKNRKLALSNLPSARFPSNFALRTLLEQKMRLRGDHLASFRKRSRIPSLIIAVVLSLEIRFRLLLQGHRLTSFDRGTFKSMFNFHAGTRWQALTERILLNLAVTSTNGKPSLRRKLKKHIMRVAATVAEFRYRRARKLDRQSAGWNLLHTQRLAEAILHKRGYCSEEARELIFKTRVWGRVEDSSDKPKDYLGPHEGLMLFHQRNYPEAIRILKLTSDYYEKTNHLTGKIKTMLFLALCYRELGDNDQLQKCLARYNQLSKGYT